MRKTRRTSNGDDGLLVHFQKLKRLQEYDDNGSVDASLSVEDAYILDWIDINGNAETRKVFSNAVLDSKDVENENVSCHFDNCKEERKHNLPSISEIQESFKTLQLKIANNNMYEVSLHLC